MKRAVVLICLLTAYLQANADILYRVQKESIFNFLDVDKESIVFIGDETFDAFPWSEAFGSDSRILNRGISSANSENIYDCIADIAVAQPAKVFLMLGSEDLHGLKQLSANEIAANILRIIELFKSVSPQTKLFVLSILPTDNQNDTYRIVEANAAIKTVCEKYSETFIDLWQVMSKYAVLNSDYSFDGRRLNSKGYSALCRVLEPYVEITCTFPKELKSNKFDLGDNHNYIADCYKDLHLNKDDIVIFGNESVNAVDWCELIGSRRIKSRGFDFSYNSVDFDEMCKMARAVFYGRESPLQIWLQTGICSIDDKEKFYEKYGALVDSLKIFAPDAELHLTALLPVGYPDTKSNVTIPLNNIIRRIAQEKGCKYFESYTIIMNDINVNRNYYSRFLPKGKTLCLLARAMSKEMHIDDDYNKIKIIRDKTFTGRGATNQRLLTMELLPANDVGIETISLNLNADAGDVDAVKLNINGKLFKSIAIKNNEKSYDFRINRKFEKETEITVTVDISANAKEGSTVSADIESIKSTKTIDWHNPYKGDREILLRRTKIVAPGDYGSMYWRIPALQANADGSLVAAIDRRKFSENDLPEDIDVTVSRSTDGGQTWTEPNIVEQGRGFAKGYGDPSLTKLANGDLLLIYNSCRNKERPDRSSYIYLRRSTDGGKTWSERTDISNVLFDGDSSHPQFVPTYDIFATSGSGTVLKKGKYAGRILIVLVCRNGMSWSWNNYVLYSDDNGWTWKISELAWANGDECKTVELDDGSVLMSIRQPGRRGHAVSKDGGVTWSEHGFWNELVGNACNSEPLKMPDGTIIHTNVNSMEREKVSVFVSNDEGKTWQFARCTSPMPSVYSTLTLQPDGTIGMLVEENPDGFCEIWYMNFSYDWLTKLK